MRTLLAQFIGRSLNVVTGSMYGTRKLESVESRPSSSLDIISACLLNMPETIREDCCDVENVCRDSLRPSLIAPWLVPIRVGCMKQGRLAHTVSGE